MPNVEHSVGIHDSTWYPMSSLRTPEQNATMAKSAGADFFVHMPGWKDILIRKESYGHLSLEPRFIDDSWHIDRIIEIVTPLPNSARLIPRNIAISMAYPIYPLSKVLTKHELDANPETSLIRRWPVFESKKPDQIKRNKIVELMSPKVIGSKEVLDIHSVNIGLTAEELIEWQKQKPGRRLMTSALMVDERLEKYGLSVGNQADLIHPLIEYISAVNLKIADLKDRFGNVLMTEKQIVQAVIAGDTNCIYGKRLRRLSEEIGNGLSVRQIDWIIKVKPSLVGGSADDNLQKQDFLHRYADYVRKVVSNN